MLIRDVILGYTLCLHLVQAQNTVGVHAGTAGGWEDWTSWIGCTSCTDLLGYRTRSCDKRALTNSGSKYRPCTGIQKQYKVCDRKGCSKSDNRQKECDKQNRIPFRGRMYRWIAHTNRVTPCDVTCKSARYGFYTSFNRFVKDGTQCDKPGDNVCLHGRCQGSSRRHSRRKRSRLMLDFEDHETTESPASISEDEEMVQPPRSRGRGRGRGRGGQRGRRVFRGRQFDEGEENRLVRLHRERQEKADDLIEQMTEEERKSLLKSLAARQPAVILDVAGILSARQQDDPQPPSPGTPVSPSWCVCTRCPDMARDEDKFCCGMAPSMCNSLRPEMDLVITDPLTLHLQQTFRNDVFAHQAETMEDTNRAFRHAAYRQYILWVFGRLQRDDRRTVPACCVQIIRAKFPSPNEQYTGLIPPARVH